MNNRRLIAICLLTAIAVGSPVAKASDEYIYCTSVGLRENASTKIYYSAIFLGDYSIHVKFSNDFYEYLNRKGYETDTPLCFHEDDYPAADRDYQYNVRSHEMIYDKVVHTHWAPDNFTKRPLRDFNVTVPSSRQKVRVCVRDHECEDGDRVRVSVNGGSVFSGEIDNRWACEVVPVNEGRNRIKLYAVNGTGRKGNCSYANVNTGEIRVEGKTGETQSWRHRGGAGSSANIIVNVK